MAATLDLLFDVYFLLSEKGTQLFDFLTREFVFPDLGTFTILDVLFGIGLPIYFGYAVFKFLLPTS